MNRSSRQPARRMFLALVALGFSHSLSAETVTVEASRDNTLYEDPSGAFSNGAGDYLFVGRTVNQGLRRAVIAFTDLGDIPPGSTINSVRLHLFLSRERSASTTLSISRLLADWGEGSSNASDQEGGGAAASVGDATWIHTFFSDQTWSTPGGDFAAAPSAQLVMDATGSYTIESTAALVADVQDWLDNPETNFGWHLMAGEGSTSAKRFNSRENSLADTRPMLEIEYTASDTPVTVNDWSGLWFDSSLDGEGYLVFNTPVGWVVYFFGYTADEEQLWLISELTDVGDPEPGVSYDFNMLVGNPGTFNNPAPSTDLLPWGSLQINFDDCGSGTFVLESATQLKISEATKLAGIDGTQCTSSAD